MNKQEELKSILLGYGLDGNRPTRVNMTRNDLAVVFAKLGYSEGAEIGVERGIFSEILCKANPDLLLLCVDPLVPYEGYREHVSKEKMDGFFQEVSRRLAPYNHFILRDFSMEALKSVEDETLDFVYIDANHDFLNTTLDIYGWSQKVKTGGIVSGHDFSRNKKKDYKCHVKDVVQAWTYAHDIKEWYVTSDSSPSWFFIKE